MERLRDIAEAIGRCQNYYPRIGGPDTQIAFDAIARNLEIIGEAAKHLPNDLRDRHPDVPWRLVVAFRNVLAHEYFQVDKENLGRVVEVHLPLLLQAALRELD